MEFREFINNKVAEKIQGDVRYQKLNELENEYWHLYNDAYYIIRNGEEVVLSEKDFENRDKDYLEQRKEQLEGCVDKKDSLSGKLNSLRMNKEVLNKLRIEHKGLIFKTKKEKELEKEIKDIEQEIEETVKKYERIEKVISNIEEEVISVDAKLKLDELIKENDFDSKKAEKEMKKIEFSKVKEVLLQYKDEPCISEQMDKALKSSGEMDQSLKKFTGRHGDEPAGKAYVAIYSQAKEMTKENNIISNENIELEEDNAVENAQ